MSWFWRMPWKDGLLSRKTSWEFQLVDDYEQLINSYHLKTALFFSDAKNSAQRWITHLLGGHQNRPPASVFSEAWWTNPSILPETREPSWWRVFVQLWRWAASHQSTTTQKHAQRSQHVYQLPETTDKTGVVIHLFWSSFTSFLDNKKLLDYVS